ncbi:hypothetical protein BA6E_104177, partial [Bacteroidales bacterium 6E]
AWSELSIKEEDVHHANDCLIYFFRKMGIDPKIKIKCFSDEEVKA